MGYLAKPQGLGDVDRPLLDLEFEKGRARPQGPHVGQQVTQAKRSVDMLGVEGGKKDAGHQFVRSRRYSSRV